MRTGEEERVFRRGKHRIRQGEALELLIHLHERGTHHLNHARGSTWQYRPAKRRWAGRAHRAELMGGPVRQKIADELSRAV